MKIKLNIDSVKFADKPTKQQMGGVRNRTAAGKQEIEAEELLQIVADGRAFTPAAMNGTAGDTWESQQVFCIDIDNAIDETDAEGKKILDKNGHAIKRRVVDPISIGAALDALMGYGISPYMVYKTFSYKHDWEKFRIVFVLPESVTDKAAALDATARLTHVLNDGRAEPVADRATKDAARIFLGSTSDCVVYAGKDLTPFGDLLALPDPPAEETKQPGEWQRPARQTFSETYEGLQAQFEADKASFDLAAYVDATTASRRSGKFFNPCPICGHRDCFNVTGSVWNCFSDGHQGQGQGSIIDYLMDKDDLDRGDAIEKFKFEVMNYDREEWRQAWMEDKRMQREQEARESFAAPLPEQADMVTDIESGGVSDFDKFLELIQTRAYEPHPTGLDFFDELLGGGVLRQSIILLLAAPSAGKTTLCMNIAEGLAKQKERVVYLSFEMSREQMYGKALSSWIRRNSEARYNAVDVLQGYEWSEIRKKNILEAAEKYREEIAPYLKYNPDGINNQLSTIKDALEAMGQAAKERGECGPVVVVDYLHLITSGAVDVKETIQEATLVLKNYAKTYDTMVYCIAATNRESNKIGRITMESGRDSSSIEYTGDYQISLNYKAVDDGSINLVPGTQTKRTPQQVAIALAELQQAPEREMILRVLKNRLGVQGKSAEVWFDAANNYFYQDDLLKNPFLEEESVEAKGTGAAVPVL